jgi:acyl-CoA synthetase (NDP forming)
VTATRALLAPRSVAVIGASSDPRKRGHQAIRRLQQDGFPYPIHPVHPTLDAVLGLRAVADVAAIDPPADLALVALPADRVGPALRACGEAGVRAAVVIAAGFGETGAAGRDLEAEAAAIAGDHDLALIGPNTNGVLHPGNRLNLVGVPDVPAGPIGLVSQSGNVGVSLFVEAAADGAPGFSAYVGIGNEAGLRFDAVLDLLADDPDTRLVAVYAEGFRDGRALLARLSQVARQLPVVVATAGRSATGRAAARSHTGAIAARPELQRAVLRQAGAVVVDRVDELLVTCEALLHQPTPRRSGVAVLADGGGHATIAADALADRGLDVAALAPATRERLRARLGPAASVAGPVDLAGAGDRDPAALVDALEALAQDPAVGAVLVTGLVGGYARRFSADLAEVEREAAVALAATAADHDLPLVVHSAYAAARPAPLAVLRAAGVPVQGSVERAVAALAALVDRGRWLAAAATRPHLDVAPSPGDPRPVTLTEPEARRLLGAADVALPAWELCEGPDATAAAVARLGPAACKLVSPTVPHRTDVGGVLLDVHGEQAAREAHVRLVERGRRAHPEAVIDGVLVTPMAVPGIELLVGALRDPTFGPVVTVAAGGVHVEAVPDVAFRAAPLTDDDVDELLDELTIAPVLRGVRGAPPIARHRLIALVRRVADLLVTRPDLLDLDLNPVIVRPDGLTIVDVRAVVDGGTHAHRRDLAGGKGASRRSRP